MANWNLSVDLRGNGGNLARTLRTAAEQSRTLGREAATAQRNVTALGGSSSTAARNLATLNRQAAAASRQLRQLADQADRANARLRRLNGNITLRARFDDQTGPGLAALHAAVRRAEALGPVRIGVHFDSDAMAINSTSEALSGLSRRARTVARSLEGLQEGAVSAAAALTALRAAASGLNDDFDGLNRHLRSLRGGLGGLNGDLTRLNNTAQNSQSSFEGLGSAALLLAPALAPIAAAAVPIAIQLGAAGAAVGAFGLAIGQQIVNLTEAAEAEQKLTEAVREHGAGSKEAAEAALAQQQVLAQMPPATQRAAAAFSDLKDSYQQWSDALAPATMPVVTKGLQTMTALLPKLSDGARGAAAQMDRLVTVAAGGVASAGFDQLMDRLNAFSTGVLQHVTDQFVHFLRVLDTDTIGSGLQEFMAYAHSVGPAVAQTLGNLARALLHIVEASSQTGVTILNVVNALAGLVNAIPAGALSALLQLVVVMKAVKLAAAGLGLSGGLIASFGVQLTAMRTAAAGSSGVLASLGAAFGALSRTAKVALIGTGIGLLVVALTQLSNIGKSTPPDVDKLTTSLGNLAKTGKVAGEAARVFGKDLSGLSDALRTLARPSNAESVQQFLTKLIGMDSTPVADAKEKLDGLDKSLANLVKNGNPELAEAAFKRVSKAMGNLTPKELRGQLDDYKSAMADLKFEQQLAADSMGVFGQQAIATSAKLDQQKASADGLRQAIQALNDANRAGLGGMIGFEAAIDAASKAAKDNAGALTMSGGKLNLNGEKARNAATALQDLAAKTDEAAGAARASGSSWEEVNGIYTRGRAALVATARTMGLNKDQAEALASSILKVPDKKSTKIEMQREDALAGLQSVQQELAKTKGKTVTVDALTQVAEDNLVALGFKVTRLKNGRVQVTAETAGAKTNLDTLIGQIKKVPGGKTIAMAAATGGAIRDLEALKTKVSGTHGKTITMRVPTEEGRRQLELLGYKIRGTKGKNVTVSVPTGTPRSQVGSIQAAINSLRGKTVTNTVRTNYVSTVSGPKGPSGQPLFKRDGGLVDYYANGGIQRGGVRHFAGGAENHVAQFARAGTWRVWAEDETGGEAYIPLAPAKRPRSRAIAEETVRRLGGDPRAISWNADGSLQVQRFAPGGFSYTMPGGGKSISDIQSSYSSAHQSISKADYTKALRARANAVDSLRSAEARLRQVRRGRHTHAQLVAAETRVSKARRSLATATDKARTAEARYKKQFSLSDWSKTLSSAVKSNAAYESNLKKVASRGGADVVDQLRDMGAEGASMVSALAKASKSQFNSIVANLRKLAPLAKATLADYTAQLNASNKTSATFQANLAKLAGMGYGDLATQLAGQNDDAAQKIAAAAVKSRSAASKANSAAKSNAKTLSSDELAQLVQIIAAVKTSRTGLHDVAGTTGLGEDEIIAVATKASSQISSSLGSRASRFLSDLGKAQKGLAYADGGIRSGIYATRGGLVRFAEPETGGEAYIPLGANKRGNATRVLSDVAGRFGLGLQDASAGRVVIIREQGPLVAQQHWHIDGNRRDIDFAREVESRTARQMRRLARGGAAAR